MKGKWIIGVDEVGRGPIAGPVVICACAFNPKYRKKLSFKDLTDSKKMTKKSREEWFKKARVWKNKKIINYKISLKNSNFIDKHGISKSIKKCVFSSIYKLNLDSQNVLVLLDGGLKAPEKFVYQKTITKGDLLKKEISLASVIAKVYRDKLMDKLHKKYPIYKWSKNKGYGTKDHFTALNKSGLTEFHRISFTKFNPKPACERQQ